MDAKNNREEKLKMEMNSWKETALIIGDRDIMKSIEISMNQIARGKGIPLSQIQ